MWRDIVPLCLAISLLFCKVLRASVGRLRTASAVSSPSLQSRNSHETVGSVSQEHLLGRRELKKVGEARFLDGHRPESEGRRYRET